MTDQMIPADKVRERIDHHRKAADEATATSIERNTHHLIASVLQALLPGLSRPTLADIPDGERAECQWMQAEVKDETECHVILSVGKPGLMPLLLSRSGVAVRCASHKVTPCPDLPRMEWPASSSEPGIEIGAIWEDSHLLTHAAFTASRDERITVAVMAVKTEGTAVYDHQHWRGPAAQPDGSLIPVGPWRIIYAENEYAKRLVEKSRWNNQHALRTKALTDGLEVTVRDTRGHLANFLDGEWAGLGADRDGTLIPDGAPWTVTQIVDPSDNEPDDGEEEPELEVGEVWEDREALDRAARESGKQVTVRDSDDDLATFNGLNWVGRAVNSQSGKLYASCTPWTIDAIDDRPEPELKVGAEWEDYDRLTRAVRTAGKRVIVRDSDDDQAAWDGCMWEGRAAKDDGTLYPDAAPWTVCEIEARPVPNLAIGSVWDDWEALTVTLDYAGLDAHVRNAHEYEGFLRDGEWHGWASRDGHLVEDDGPWTVTSLMAREDQQ